MGQPLPRLIQRVRSRQSIKRGSLVGASDFELVSDRDTPELAPHVRAGIKLDKRASPIDYPQSGALEPISEIFQRLRPLVGTTIADQGFVQDRNRAPRYIVQLVQPLAIAAMKTMANFQTYATSCWKSNCRSHRPSTLALCCRTVSNQWTCPRSKGTCQGTLTQDMRCYMQKPTASS